MGLASEPRPTKLDPVPTLFGTGRIDELVGPDGKTEYDRALLWILNRAARMAFGARLQATLIGDPIAQVNIFASTQPLRDYLADRATPIDDTDPDTVYGEPVTNWGPNDT